MIGKNDLETKTLTALRVFMAGIGPDGQILETPEAKCQRKRGFRLFREVGTEAVEEGGVSILKNS